MFNAKYIKDNAQPGSWRRGYDYHKKNMVLEMKLSRNVITGKVKGNFQDFYTTKLTIDKDFNVKAKCDCPLEEEWCKHAVCVGLQALENGTFEQYYNKKNKIKPPVSRRVYLTPYIFYIDTLRVQKCISIKIVERESGDVITNLKGLLTWADYFQEQNPDFEFTPDEQQEFVFIQALMKYGRLDKSTGFYDVSYKNVELFFDLLAQIDDVRNIHDDEPIEFDENLWNLVLTVNVSQVGTVLLSVHWYRPDPVDVLPFEEVTVFSRTFNVYMYKNIIFKADAILADIPQNIIKSSFTDIKDTEGAKFLYEDLPKLRKVINVEMSDTLSKLTLERRPPKNVLLLSLDRENGIKAELEFEYDGIRVPYARANKVPYVTVKRPDDGLIYWVKRNPKHENKAYEILVNSKFAPMQTNNLYLDPDIAIDFYNFFMDKAGDEWVIEEKQDLSCLKVMKDALKVCAKMDFCKTVDSFSLEIFCMCGKKKIDFKIVEEAMFQGQKYFSFSNEGFLEVPHTKLMILSKMLNSYDAQKTDEEYTFLIKTFRVGIIAELKELGIELKMSKKFSHFWDQISTFNIDEKPEIPVNINAKLREYQERGIGWLWFLYQYGLNGILADDMGLGKTLQMLSLIQKAKNEEGPMPSLIIAPTSVVFNWESEISKFTPELTILNLTGADRHDFFKKIPKYDIILTSYALVRRDIELFRKFNFRIITLDESQNIKNYESITAKAVKRIESQHRFALSGTPIENRLTELWSIFDFLMPGFLLDLSEFKYRFVTPITEKGDTSVENRLKKQIYPFILRRMKRDVAKDLPEKIENIAFCEMTEDQEALYQEILDDTRETLLREIQNNGMKNSKMSIFAALLRLRQICCHPKLIKQEAESGKFEHLKDMIEEITSEGHRILLFSQFVKMLDIIKDYFERAGIKYEYLTGDTKDRKERIDRFNNDESVQVFLLSLKAGGTGLNLTGADYVIHYDPWWNPAVEDQATDRAYRIGQTKNVMVYRLITKNSVEEKIQKLKGKKRDLVDSVISVDREIGKTLTYEDIKDILGG